MDARFLQYYERELLHLREAGGEFAQRFPKIAGRLGLESFSCADPYVERLLEGFSFLAARIQLKIDAEFPNFTNQLLDMLFPQYLAPLPSMAVVQMQPDLDEGNLANGFTLPRGTVLTSHLANGEQTACEFRTAHAVTLWPLELGKADYFPFAGELGDVDVRRLGDVRACLRLRLRTTAGLNFGDLSLAALPLFLRGADALPYRLMEQCLVHALGVAVLPVQRKKTWSRLIDKDKLRPLGFEDDCALLPTDARYFQGHRLIREYFACPERFMFVEVGGLDKALKDIEENQVDLVFLFDQFEPGLERVVGPENFALFCTPAINLFPKKLDRIHLDEGQHEYHAVPDLSRPQDFEVFQVTEVMGYGSGGEMSRRFLPLHCANDCEGETATPAYFQLRRDRRALSMRQRRDGPRSSYLGSEAFLSLVDAAAAPLGTDLRQLGIDALCTNRDLVMSMPLGAGSTDFFLEASAPVAAVRCVAGPTVPLASYAEGETAWRLIQHLGLNYLSLADSDDGERRGKLRELLLLHARPGDIAALRQIEGIQSVRAEPVVRRYPGRGPACFCRGLQVEVTVENAAFEGARVFLLGAVLECFFARYAGLNSFTEMVIRTLGSDRTMQWPARIGSCPSL